MKWLLLLQLVTAVSAAAAVLGIDLGTDFVKGSLVAPNAPFELVLTPDTARKDASGLVIKPGDSERIYGSAGLALAAKFPGEALYATKQLLGIQYDDLRVALFSQLNPGLDLVPTKRGTVAVKVSGEVLPVEEIVAMQLHEMAVRGEALLQEKMHSKRERLRQVAVSVPGYFDSAQRQALVDSVNLANLELVSLVSDGVAVAINYANQPSVLSKLGADEHTVVVYDVGAGAAEATLVGISLVDNVVNVDVKGYGSAIELGGRALTSIVRELILKHFKEKTGKAAERTPRLMNRLWREAERAKQVLSANAEVHVYIESLSDDRDLSTKITRQEFEKIAKYQRDLVPKLLDDATSGAGADALDAVVLVGGATRTPFILDTLASAVGEQKLSKNVNADEANVQGTAMRGVNLSGLYRAKRHFSVHETAQAAYSAHIVSSKGTETVDIFPAGSALDSSADIPLPNDLRELVLYENMRKVTTWEFPYLAKNVESLHEPGAYTCVGPAQLVARFQLSENGVVSLRNVEAVCDSVRTATSSATSSAVSQTASDTSSASSDASEASRKTSTEVPTSSSASASASATPRPKTRRVSAQAQWVQAPLGTTEQSDIRAHLLSLDRKDADRREMSTLSHELEVLAYRLRAFVNEGEAELGAIGESLLEFVETGSFHMDELKEKLVSARELVAKSAIEPSEPASESASEATTEPDEVDHEEL